jgi:hypothetical protein
MEVVESITRQFQDEAVMVAGRATGLGPLTRRQLSAERVSAVITDFHPPWTVSNEYFTAGSGRVGIRGRAAPLSVARS